MVRKTLGYSKKLKMLRASSIWEEVLYNLGRVLKTLRVERARNLMANGAGWGVRQRWRRD